MSIPNRGLLYRQRQPREPTPHVLCNQCPAPCSRSCPLRHFAGPSAWSGHLGL